MLLCGTLAWLGLMLLAILNGAFREAVLAPRLTPATAHVASTAILCIVIVVFTWYAVGWVGPGSGGEAVLLGIVWLALTLAFEFGFGYFVAGRSIPELLAEYDVLGGRVWILVPVTVLVAPYAAGRLRSLF